MRVLSPAAPLDQQIAERVMAVPLDWTHAAYRTIADQEDPTVNAGRGIFMRCAGCGYSAPANEWNWTLRCPSPPCPAYSSDLTLAWTVLAVVGTVRFGQWFDRAHLWADPADQVAAAICTAALALIGD